MRSSRLSPYTGASSWSTGTWSSVSSDGVLLREERLQPVEAADRLEARQVAVGGYDDEGRALALDRLARDRHQPDVANVFVSVSTNERRKS